MKNVNRILFGLSVVSLPSCSKSTTFPELTQITKIQVVRREFKNSSTKANAKWITDKKKIASLVDFVNKHNSGWYSPFDTMPMAQGAGLVFYQGQTEQRVLAIGSNFFSSRGQGKWVLKNASEQQKQELENLIKQEK